MSSPGQLGITPDLYHKIETAIAQGTKQFEIDQRASSPASPGEPFLGVWLSTNGIEQLYWKLQAEPRWATDIVDFTELKRLCEDDFHARLAASSLEAGAVALAKSISDYALHTIDELQDAELQSARCSLKVQGEYMFGAGRDAVRYTVFRVAIGFDMEIDVGSERRHRIPDPVYLSWGVMLGSPLWSSRSRARIAQAEQSRTLTATSSSCQSYPATIENDAPTSLFQATNLTLE